MKVDHIVWLVLAVGCNVVYKVFTTEKAANKYVNNHLFARDLYVVSCEVWE